MMVRLLTLHTNRERHNVEYYRGTDDLIMPIENYTA